MTLQDNIDISTKIASIVALDDHPIYSVALNSILESVPGIQFKKSFFETKDLYRYLTTYKCNILLLDLSMPGISGYTVLRKVRQSFPKTKVIIVSAEDSEFNIAKTYREGASGFVPKDSSSDEIIGAIKTVLNGQKYISPKHQESLIDLIVNPVNYEKEQLSEKESEVLKLICSEFNSKEISEHLGVSIHTVNAHRKSILKKTSSENLVSLIKYAYQYGYLD